MAEQKTVRKSNTEAAGTRTRTTSSENGESANGRSRTPRSSEPLSRAARTKREEQRRRAKQHLLIREITMLLVICVCTICFVSCFVKSMDWLKDFNYFLFGKMMYIAPFIICILTWIFLFLEFSPALIKRLAGILIFLLAVHGIISAAVNPDAGGLPGKFMDLIVRSWLGNVGSYIVYVMMIAVSFVLLTDFSISEWISERTDPENEKYKQRQEALALKRERRELLRKEQDQNQLDEMRRSNRALEERVRRRSRSTGQYVSLRGIGDTTLTGFDDDDSGTTLYGNDEDLSAAIYNGDEEFVRNPQSLSKYGNSGYVTNKKELEERRKKGEDTSFIPDIHVPEDMFPEDQGKDELPASEKRSELTSAAGKRMDASLRAQTAEKEGSSKDRLFRMISETRKNMRRSDNKERDPNSTTPSDDPYRSVHFEKRSFRKDTEPAKPLDQDIPSSDELGGITSDLLSDDIGMNDDLGLDPADAASRSEALYQDMFGEDGEDEDHPSVRPGAHSAASGSRTTAPRTSGSAAGVEKAAKTDKQVQHIPQVKIPQVLEKEYVFPPYRLLKRGSGAGISKTELQRDLKETAEKLQHTLQTFGVGVTITNISCGPTVTRYEILPEMGVKVSKIVSLTDDIKLNLAAEDIRMEAPIPGKSAIGIEIPNKVKQSVVLRDLMESDAFTNTKSKLAFAAGRDLEGNVIIADIARMPHVLVAGATGSGKSVCINTMIMSIIYHAKPTEVKMIMVDPKVVELSVYNGIPHLLLPVVTDPKKAASALNWAVAEMEKRYVSFAEYGVRGIEGFNELIDRTSPVDDLGQPVRRMPQILIIVDELADLMMVAPGDVENAICRLAQKARAAGIHLVLATQRPSVDVITGLIKANIPSRIAFAVSSGVDSRTILDMNGAEKLLGRGDMLYSPAGSSKPVRVQGAFVSDDEVKAVVDFVSHQGNVKGGGEESIDLAANVSGGGGESASDRDEYFAQAGRLVIDKEKASIGMLQRTFKLGFNRAARIVDQLCDAGVVGEEEGTKPRRVLMTAAEFEAYLNEHGEG